MKKLLTTTVLFAFLGVLQSCQPAARAPVETAQEEEAGGAATKGSAAAKGGAGADAGTTPAAPSGGTTAPAAVKPAEPPALALSPECQAIYDELKKLRAGIPYIFHDLQRSHEDIDKDLIRSIELGDRFLKNCGESAYSAEVKASFARHLSSRYKRQEFAYKDALTKQLGLPKLTRAQRAQVAAQVKSLMKSYLDRIEQLGQEALAASRPGDATHCEGLSVLADLSFNYLGDNKSHIELSRQYIAAGCEDVLAGNQDYHFNIGMLSLIHI